MPLKNALLAHARFRVFELLDDIVGERRPGARVTLLVTDAQLLSRGALELLLGLGHIGAPRFPLAVALIGNDEFDADGAGELARTVRGDKVVVRVEFSLADLTPDDVRQFLTLKGVRMNVRQRVLSMIAREPLSLRKVAALAEEAG